MQWPSLLVMLAVLVDCLFFDYLRSLFLMIMQYLYSGNIVRWRHVHLKKLLQIIVSSFFDSYATSFPASYTTFPMAVMRITEFKRVQFSSLLLSTSLCLKQRKRRDLNHLALVSHENLLSRCNHQYRLCLVR